MAKVVPRWVFGQALSIERQANSCVHDRLNAVLCDVMTLKPVGLGLFLLFFHNMSWRFNATQAWRQRQNSHKP